MSEDQERIDAIANVATLALARINGHMAHYDGMMSRMQSLEHAVRKILRLYEHPEEDYEGDGTVIDLDWFDRLWESGSEGNWESEVTPALVMKLVSELRKTRAERDALKRRKP